MHRKEGNENMSYFSIRYRRSVSPILAVLACTCLLCTGCGSDSKNDAGAKDASAQSVVRVVVTPVSKRVFERRVVVQGNLEAKNFADVSARVEGTLEAIFVDEHDSVEAGKTKLFQVDSVKLKQMADVRRQDLAVARCSLREAQAGLEQVEAQLAKVELDLKRYEKLHESKTVSSDAFEQVQTQYKQVKAAREHSVSLVDLQKELVRQAEISLSIAEKDLSDSLVLAPIDGTVSRKYHEVGEMPEKGKPVLRIDDTSVIEVSAFLPAQNYADVRPERTFMSIQVGKAKVGDFPISYRSPTIDPQLRTFEVKCVITDPPEGVVPGAMADVTIVLERVEGLGVPSQAVQRRGEDDVVFAVGSETAHIVKVKTGLETDGYIHLKESSLSEGTPVVTQGQSFLNDGSPVKVLSEGD